ncbi:hypothetical protein ACOME3_002148 [Neoechinorhynchus agilis]
MENLNIFDAEKRQTVRQCVFQWLNKLTDSAKIIDFGRGIEKSIKNVANLFLIEVILDILKMRLMSVDQLFDSNWIKDCFVGIESSSFTLHLDEKEKLFYVELLFKIANHFDYEQNSSISTWLFGLISQAYIKNENIDHSHAGFVAQLLSKDPNNYSQIMRNILIELRNRKPTLKELALVTVSIHIVSEYFSIHFIRNLISDSLKCYENADRMKLGISLCMVCEITGLNIAAHRIYKNVGDGSVHNLKSYFLDYQYRNHRSKNVCI